MPCQLQTALKGSFESDLNQLNYAMLNVVLQITSLPRNFQSLFANGGFSQSGHHQHNM